MDKVIEAGNMDWAGLIINVSVIFIGFAVYLLIYNNKKLSEKLGKYQYPVLLAVLIGAVLLGGFLRFIFRV